MHFCRELNNLPNKWGTILEKSTITQPTFKVENRNIRTMCETMFAKNECQNDVKNDVNDVILIVLQISQISQIVLVFPLGVSHLVRTQKLPKKLTFLTP